MAVCGKPPQEKPIVKLWGFPINHDSYHYLKEHFCLYAAPQLLHTQNTDIQIC